MFDTDKVIQLKDNGINILVNNSNKREYVYLVALYKMHTRIQMQINALLQGIYDMVPKKLMSIFTCEELQLLI